MNIGSKAINIGIRGHDFEINNIEMLAQKCEMNGIYNIQLALLKTALNLDLKRGMFSPGLAYSIKSELDRHKVHISVLGCYINPVHYDEKVREEQLELFCEHIKYAKFLGADMIGTETGSISKDGQNTPENRSEEVYNILLNSMRRLVLEAEKLGVMIGVEAVTCYILYSPSIMKRFLDDINSPNVQVIFDPVNLLSIENYERQDEIIEQSFELFGNKIAAVHLKDFEIKNGKLYSALPGEGLLNYILLFKLLKKFKPGISMLLEDVKENDLEVVRRRLEQIYNNA